MKLGKLIDQNDMYRIHISKNLTKEEYEENEITDYVEPKINEPNPKLNNSCRRCGYELHSSDADWKYYKCDQCGFYCNDCAPDELKGSKKGSFRSKFSFRR